MVVFSLYFFPNLRSCIVRSLCPFYNADILSILNAFAILLVRTDGLDRDC